MSASTRLSIVALACAFSSSAPAPAHALNILLTNDDGFESASLHAVYRGLEALGHSVVISAPALDATAQAGGVIIGRAIEALPMASRGGAVPAGGPGIGTFPDDPDIHYVLGSPVMSLLYGLDIVAKEKWGKAPDLVVSGVNYGLNVGKTWSGSGTVGAAIAAISRGVPAIAVSAEYPISSYVPIQQLQPGAREYDLAAFVVQLVQAVELSRPSPAAPLLPRPLGLNVNLPVFPPGSVASLPVKLSQTGSGVDRTSVFVSNLQRDWPVIGPFLPAGPGIAYLARNELPADFPWLVDDDPSSEVNVVKAGAAAVSVVQASVQVDTPWSAEGVGARILAKLAELKRQAALPTPPHPAPTGAPAAK